MERFKNSNTLYKSLLAAFGLGSLTFLSYLFYRKYKKALSPNKSTGLSKDEAMRRSNNVRNLKYTLFLQLNQGHLKQEHNTYDGGILIEFNLEKIEDIFLDFEGIVNKVYNNGKLINPQCSNGKIYLRAKDLSSCNKLNIVFTNHYSHVSQGIKLHFNTNEDGSINNYIFTQMEPYYANKVFPCFDQPNMKAPFKLFIATNSTWKVISAGQLIKKYETKKDYESLSDIFKSVYEMKKIHDVYSLFEFEETIPITTYAFAVCAGDYDEVNFSDDQMKVKIYKRKEISFAEDENLIFNTVKHSFKWVYNNITKINPYGKNDLVFVPGLDIKAMENVGCITFDEKFLDQTKSPMHKTYFHYLIVHEIMHTWFGNYVTPEWWDDLWLNESFATFLASLCLKEIGDITGEEIYQNVWLLFNKFKGKGIEYDQFKSNHKVRDVVNDTNHAQIVFDEITYSKGASILKYLYYFVGRDKFLKSLQLYIEKYVNKNAHYEDFKEIIRGLLDDNLNPSTIIEPFIDNVGINSLKCEIIKSPHNNIDDFIVTQINSSHSTDGLYYKYRTDILLVYQDKEEIIEGVQIQGERTSVKELIGKPIPEGILLNYNDTGYFKQVFTHDTSAWFTTDHFKLKDPLMRLLVSRDLYEMVRDGLYTVDDYVRFTHNMLIVEKNDFIIEQVLNNVINLITNFVNGEKQILLKDSVFNLIDEYLFIEHHALTNVLVSIILDIIDSTNHSEINSLLRLLDGTTRETLDFTRGRSMILDQKIQSYNLKDLNDKTKLKLLELIFESTLTKNEKEEIITNLKNSDSKISEIIQNNTILLNACTLDIKQKSVNWEILVNRKGNKPFAVYESLMRGFARTSQYNQLKNYFEKKFFDDFLEVKANQSEDYAVMFFKYLSPSFINSKDILKEFFKLERFVYPHEYKIQNILKNTISKLQYNIKNIEKNSVQN